MEEPDAAFEDATSLRLLLVPLGGISPEHFDHYAQLFEPTVKLPLGQVTHPDKWSPLHSPFSPGSFSWYSGSLKLRWDRAPPPPPPPPLRSFPSPADGGGSHWQDFSASRRVFGAIGLLHYPTWLARCRASAVAAGHGVDDVDPDSPMMERDFAAAACDVEGELTRALAAVSMGGAGPAVLRVCVFGQTFADLAPPEGSPLQAMPKMPHADQLVVFPPDDDDDASRALATAKAAQATSGGAHVGDHGDPHGSGRLKRRGVSMGAVHAQVVLDGVALEMLLLLEETARAVAAAIASPDPLRLAHLPGSPQSAPAKRSVSHGPSAPSGSSPAQGGLKKGLTAPALSLGGVGVSVGGSFDTAGGGAGRASGGVIFQLRSPLDDEEGDGPRVRGSAGQSMASDGPVSASKWEKRCRARLRKVLGDLCLLATSSLDAVRHFAAAAAEAKAASDPLWQAGALEGLCAALVDIVASRRSAKPGRQRAPIAAWQLAAAHSAETSASLAALAHDAAHGAAAIDAGNGAGSSGGQSSRSFLSPARAALTRTESDDEEDDDVRRAGPTGNRPRASSADEKTDKDSAALLAELDDVVKVRLSV